MVSVTALENKWAETVEALYREMVEEDELPQVNKWPRWWKDILFKPNKSHQETYRIFCFLVRNGVAAHVARKYILWWTNREVLCNNPRGVKYHVDSMVNEWQSGDPLKLYNFFMPSVMDLETGKPWRWNGSKQEFATWWTNKQQAPTGLDALVAAAEAEPEPEDEEDKELARQMDRAIEEHHEEVARATKKREREAAEEIVRKRRRKIVEAAKERAKDF